MRSALAVFAMLAAVVLGFGYWHVGTHGTLHVYLHDKAKQNGHVYDGKLIFYDAGGKLLARAKTDNKFGVVRPQNPISGYCGPELAADAFHACFAIETVWLMEWVSRTHHAEIQAGACHIEDIPIKVLTHPDNIFMWWVPLPHAGGVPRTHYSFNITIDSGECHVVQR